MAITVETSTKQTITLEEYLEYLSAHLDIDDPDSVMRGSDMLAGLARNKTFLAEEIARQLRDLDRFQNDNRYLSSFLLGKGKGYFVRANTWEPPIDDAFKQATRDELGAYGMMHDHNFSFLTAGYSGPGYRTRIFEYDRSAIQGVLGEHVPLRFLEETTLPPGKVMYYRDGRDVHAQSPPPDLSVSLNLMIVRPVSSVHEQFYIDKTSHRIVAFGGNQPMARVFLCELATYFDSPATRGALAELVERHPSPRVRRRALESLATLAPSDAAMLDVHRPSEVLR